MEINISDFILEADGFFSQEQCDEMIKYYEKMNELGLSYDRQEFVKDTSKISDRHVYVADGIVNVGNNEILKYFTSIFWGEVYQEYLKKYGSLNDMRSHNIHHFKLQKTNPGGEGYHVWHFENTGMHHASRIMFFILYLNDVDDGGETEFLYLSRRIKPKMGKLILAPAYYTHTHRGNPPLTNSKYIFTGWVEFG